jgi:hypothetical protein
MAGQRPPVSSLSREPLTYTITAAVDGNPWFPGVGTTFEGAYLPSSAAKPQPSDWVIGSTEVNEIGSVVGLVMIGPGAKVLAVGTWYEWTRLTDPATGVQVVRSVGTVDIQ